MLVTEDAEIERGGAELDTNLSAHTLHIPHHQMPDVQDPASSHTLHTAIATSCHQGNVFLSPESEWWNILWRFLIEFIIRTQYNFLYCLFLFTVHCWQFDTVADNIHIKISVIGMRFYYAHNAKYPNPKFQMFITIN